MSATTDSQSRDITVRITAHGYKGWEHKAQWSATVGALTGRGSTATAAADDVAAQLVRLAETVHTKPVVVMYGGYVSVATADAHGWTERTYRPDGTYGCVSGRGGSRAHVEAAMRSNLAQRITDWSDDESVRAGAAFCSPDDATEMQNYGPTEFFRYAAFQRAAIAAQEAGRPDVCEWAHEHRDEFAISA